MTPHLRRAGTDDLDAIMAIEEATFPDDAWSRDSMERELAGEHGWYLVAVEGDAVIGYAGLLAPRGSGQADVQTIAVVPEARRGGLGRALMLALIGEARERRALEVFLEVRADNPGAQALYERLGFEQIAVRPRYYRGVVDALIMRLEVPAPRTLPATGRPS
ncbi:ribosomal protein S18-alanine N-acetyltransferase [Homoserinibacter sp. YIM 151385]|uniref:ribosomal protein S18-alanine N-acetyltransferase n=1 Tax=Homoserinibacter sp. YIM 151385 TaxID=2985506 RepID=UPI0022F07F69|nr:ribosomal protein S18-alanine N-acetyltransferase [Homoserinibacter sp. YIM 151385]WBU37715.1 ribosomal protein S18-alanine N-acetyltransferase [Homoserinibacter sp. YIM 151385]